MSRDPSEPHVATTEIALVRFIWSRTNSNQNITRYFRNRIDQNVIRVRHCSDKSIIKLYVDVAEYVALPPVAREGLGSISVAAKLDFD